MGESSIHCTDFTEELNGTEKYLFTINPYYFSFKNYMYMNHKVYYYVENYTHLVKM